MRVFISWSGEASRHIGEALVEWLPQVINALEPFISTEIEKGAQWAAELAQQLNESNAGIICLTPENLASPWLNYEAGALAKSIAVDASGLVRVWTYLFKLRPADIRYPLAQFQHTEATRADTLRLVRGMNAAVERTGERSLPEAQLIRSFDRWWPDLESSLKGIKAFDTATDPSPRRSQDEMLAEILEMMRAQGREHRTHSIVTSTPEVTHSPWFRPLSRHSLSTQLVSGMTATVRGTEAEMEALEEMLGSHKGVQTISISGSGSDKLLVIRLGERLPANEIQNAYFSASKSLGLEYDRNPYFDFQ